jgi:hypothetical protein
VPSVYGYELDTAFPLRRLNPGPGPRGAIRVVPAEEPITERAGTLTGYLDAEDGRALYAIAEAGRECVIWCSRSGAYLVDPEARTIRVEANGDSELFEHRLLSSAVCLLLSLRGELVLHASAAEIAGSAVVFCGPTGRGKSTLVRVLGELGVPVLSEDGVVIAPEGGGWMVHPGARGVRVRPPGQPTARGRLQPNAGPAPRPRPLSHLVVLEPRGGEMRLERLEKALALPRLTSNLINTGGRESIAGSLQLLAGACAAVEVVSLRLPDSLERLPEAARAMIHSLEDPR